MSESDHTQQLVQCVQDGVRFKQQNQTSQNMVQQVVNNELFKMLIKDMFEELLMKKNLQEQQQKIYTEKRVTAQSLIQQIGDSLMIIAQNQANKKIKQAEKFMNQMYELKIKQLENKFQGIVERKIKEIQGKMSQIEQKSKIQQTMLSPVRSPLKNRQILQQSVSQQINRRMELKQKILNSSLIPEQRHSSIVEVNSNSLFSESLNDAVLEKLSQKIKQIDENLRQETKSLSQKIANIRNQVKTDLEETESNFKQQINSGFEGIWNVISNLEKRMMI